MERLGVYLVWKLTLAGMVAMAVMRMVSTSRQNHLLVPYHQSVLLAVVLRSSVAMVLLVSVAVVLLASVLVVMCSSVAVVLLASVAVVMCLTVAVMLLASVGW